MQHLPVQRRTSNSTGNSHEDIRLRGPNVISERDQFHDLISREPTTAASVLYFQLSYRSVQSARCSWHPILDKLSSFSNLRTVHLDHSILRRELCIALTHLPNLVTMQIADCQLYNNDSGTVTSPQTTSQLCDVTISSCPGKGWSVLIPNSVHKLHLVDMDPSSSGEILSDLMWDRRTAQGLTELEILRRPPGNIAHFLTTCTSLKKVALSCVSPDVCASLEKLPAGAMPLLEEFSGELEYLQAFVSGRPVHSVKIFGYQDADHPPSFSPLKASTVPVTKLELRGDADAGKITPHMLKDVPLTLRELTWDYQKLSTVKSWLPILSQMYELRVLSGHRWMGQNTFKERQNLARAAGETCGALQVFNFECESQRFGSSKLRYTYETFRKDQDGNWKFDKEDLSV